MNDVPLDEMALRESYILCSGLAEINNAALYIAQCYDSTQKVLNVLTYFDCMEVISLYFRRFVEFNLRLFCPVALARR